MSYRLPVRFGAGRAVPHAGAPARGCRCRGWRCGRRSVRAAKGPRRARSVCPGRAGSRSRAVPPDGVRAGHGPGGRAGAGGHPDGTVARGDPGTRVGRDGLHAPAGVDDLVVVMAMGVDSGARRQPAGVGRGDRLMADMRHQLALHRKRDRATAPDHDEVRTNASITLLSVGHACVDVYQGAVASLVPSFVAERAYGYAVASGIVLAASLLSSVAQPLFGALTDRWPMPWQLPVSTLLSGAGIALSGLSGSYGINSAVRGGVGGRRGRLPSRVRTRRPPRRAGQPHRHELVLAGRQRRLRAGPAAGGRREGRRRTAADAAARAAGARPSAHCACRSCARSGRRPGVVFVPGPALYVCAALTSAGLYVPFSLQVTLGQDYLHSRLGTAGGITLRSRRQRRRPGEPSPRPRRRRDLPADRAGAADPDARAELVAVPHPARTGYGRRGRGAVGRSDQRAGLLHPGRPDGGRSEPLGRAVSRGRSSGVRMSGAQPRGHRRPASQLPKRGQEFGRAPPCDDRGTRTGRPGPLRAKGSRNGDRNDHTNRRPG